MHISNLFAAVTLATGMLGALPCNAADTPDTAVAAYQRKDYETAYQLALPAARAGDANAQHLLGLQLWRGRGVMRNDAEAARWFTSAAEQNHAEAMTDLAAMYRQGEGVEQDAGRSFSLSTKAADMGNSTAQYDVGQAYQKGTGVTKDMIRARYWLERADATESAASWAAIPREKRPPSGTLKAIPSDCKPKQPPLWAMRQSNVTQVTGSVSAMIDSEGRIRGVTERNVSIDALKYDVVAFFSASLRSPNCVFPKEARNFKFEIPFIFESTSAGLSWRR